jgi:hypothetical protein
LLGPKTTQKHVSNKNKTTKKATQTIVQKRHLHNEQNIPVSGKRKPDLSGTLAARRSRRWPLAADFSDCLFL